MLKTRLLKVAKTMGFLAAQWPGLSSAAVAGIQFLVGELRSCNAGGEQVISK